jgi:RNA polymerase sigma factor (sigma-70 family)
VAKDQTGNLIDHFRRAVLAGGEADLTDGQLLECFVSGRNEKAVAALVRRHGPMVWGVCRRVLRNHHDAEDAFQATFLVLVRKAASIVPRELVGNWLYGVAHQTALKARATAAKRQAREKQVKELPEPEAVTQPGLWDDLEPLLDQELSRLPDKYRVAIVLCDLKGKSRKEVARQLSIPEGTLSSRLTTARAMLAKRLARHGLAVSGGGLAAALSQKAASASVPTSVVSSTIKAASLLAAGGAAAGVASVKVAALTEGVLKTMLLNKLKMAMVVVLVLGMVATGVGAVPRLLKARQQDEKQTPPARRSPNGKDGKKGDGKKDDKAPQVAALTKAKTDAAHKAYDEAMQLLQQTRRMGSVIFLLGKSEDVYTWSVRWMAAEREAKSDKEGEAAALANHLKRMKDLEQVVKKLRGGGLVTSLDPLAVEYYIKEAEVWLARAKGK